MAKIHADGSVTDASVEPAPGVEGEPAEEQTDRSVQSDEKPAKLSTTPSKKK